MTSGMRLDAQRGKKIMQRIGNTRKFVVALAIILALAGIAVVSSHTVVTSASAPTYVLLVHGYSFSGSPSPNYWTTGPDIYQLLVSQGYIVGTVEYYGTFSITYSNGMSFTDPSFYGTQYTPIENIANELAKGISTLSQNQNNKLDIVVHSMGGLITLQTLENNYFPNVNLKQVIFIASPFNGSPFAELADILGWAIGYQATEMETGSTFLSQLQNNVGNAVSNYPNTIWTVYAGNYDPWWTWPVFFGADNDGVVSVNSATYLGYSYVYYFNDVHTSGKPTYGTPELSDPALANTIVSNLAGHF